MAFSVLALSLGVLLRIFSGALHNVGVSREQEEALVIAQSLLARAGVETPLMTGESAGRHGDRFDWRLTVAPFEEERGVGSRQSTVAVGLWQISVRVAWRDGPGSGERTVALSTLRIQGAGP